MVGLVATQTAPAIAQSESPAIETSSEEDRGYLQALIEDNLSSDGTKVRIKGFVGSLASASSFDRLTVADADGVWLTLEDASLDWRRRALLSGTLDISDLRVARIVVERLPAPAKTKAEAEATPFALPDLPVEVNLGAINAGAIVLGPTVLGTAAELSLNGSANLSGGEGELALSLNRIDGQRGMINLTADYSNTDTVLGLDLLLDEEEDGIAARLLDLYQKPALRLSVKGNGPLSDFRADIDLSANGAQSLTGQVMLFSDAQAPEAGQQFSATVSGDIAPLLAPQFMPFLGNQVTLDIAGARPVDKRLRLDRLHLETAALQFDGQVQLEPGGMPEQFDLTGTITPAGQDRVILPLPGVETSVQSVELTASFDANAGDTWQLDAHLTGFVRDGLSLQTARLSGSGTLHAATEGDIKAASAKLRLLADGVAHRDPELAGALGPRLEANAVLAWQEGTPLHLSAVTFDGAGLALSGSGMVDGADTGFLASGQANLTVDQIARFAGLAGRDIAGGAEVVISGQTALRGGSFDIELTGQTQDLSVGEARVDPLLAGRGTVALAAVRDAQGLRLSRLKVETEHARVETQGKLSSTAGQVTFDAQITELARIETTLSGPATATGTLSWLEGAPIVLDQLKFNGAAATLTATVQVDITDPDLPVSGTVQAEAGDLAQFKGLAGIDMSGRATAQAEGQAELKGQDFGLTLTAKTQNVTTGIVETDRFLAGQGSIAAKLGRTDGNLIIDRLDLSTPAIQIKADSQGANTPIQFHAKLANVGMIAPDFSGPATARGSARPQGDNWAIDMAATGPGGINANIDGQLATNLSTADLAIVGTAPLGLANPFIAPRSLQGRLNYELRLNGAPNLQNLSGRVTSTDARLSAPKLLLVLSGIDANVGLAGGSANLDITGSVQGGGTVWLRGPLSLQPPFSAGLEATLRSATFSDPTLYKTRINGGVSISGPLTGGGKLAGQLTLAETELQVPSSQASSTGYVPDITHIAEPAASRQTRARAGLLAEQVQASTSGAGLDLDLQILAPGRIFVRGRGLDAEFGGDLRLLGDTNAIVPQGQFDLIRGRLDILGKRFDLTRGLINIQGAFDPYISLIAETVTDTVTSRIIIEGPASDLSVSFTSDPELPEDEVVAQLLFGRDLTSLSAFQLAQLASAVATLTGRGGEGLVAKLRSGIGLDDLDVSSNETGETTVRAGKYLSENLYSDIAVDSAGKTEVNLNLDLNSNVKVKGRVTGEGDTGVGIYFQRDY